VQCGQQRIKMIEKEICGKHYWIVDYVRRNHERR